MRARTYTELNYNTKCLTKTEMPIQGVTQTKCDTLGTIHNRIVVCGVKTAAVFYIVKQEVQTFLGWDVILDVGPAVIFGSMWAPCQHLTTVNSYKQSTYKQDKKIRFKLTTI